MPSADVEPGAEEIRLLVEAAAKTLAADSRRFARGLRDASGGAPVPLRLFKVIAQSRRHALAAFVKVQAVETEHPAKRLALTWLGVGTAGLSALYRALAAEHSAPKRSKQQHARARAAFESAANAFGELDRELGCPFGCKKPA